MAIDATRNWRVELESSQWPLLCECSALGRNANLALHYRRARSLWQLTGSHSSASKRSRKCRRTVTRERTQCAWNTRGSTHCPDWPGVPVCTASSECLGEEQERRPLRLHLKLRFSFSGWQRRAFLESRGELLDLLVENGADADGEASS